MRNLPLITAEFMPTTGNEGAPTPAMSETLTVPVIRLATVCIKNSNYDWQTLAALQLKMRLCCGAFPAMARVVFAIRGRSFCVHPARIRLGASSSHLVPDRAAKLQRQFGSTLRAERKARNLTQEKLAFAAGLSLTYIGEIERGQRMVSLDTLRRVASALDLTGAELLQRARL